MRNKAIHKIFEQSKNGDENSVTFVLLYTRPENRAKFKGPKCLFDYRDSNILQEQIKEIRSGFKNSDIIVCTGIDFHKVFKERTPDFRIIDNIQYEDTGTAEEVKLGILNSYSSNIIFLRDDFVVDKKYLMEMSKESKLLVSSRKISEVKVISENKIVRKVGFAGSHHFSGCFSISENEYKISVQYLLRDYNKNKLDIEMLNYIVDNGGKFKLLEK
jgi:hypothetical protein